MYSTTESIMYPAVGPLYPFLREVRDDDYITEDEDDDYNNLYPDSEHDDCYCGNCGGRMVTVYEPPFTRLQARNKQKLIDITNTLIESFTQLNYYWFEYMEEQKHYTKNELEDKLNSHGCYITEEIYRKTCNRIKDQYEDERDSLLLYNRNDFTQFIMKEYRFDSYYDQSVREHKFNMYVVNHLKRKISRLTRVNISTKTY